MQGRRIVAVGGCPAHAGIGPTNTLLQEALARLPRTRGDRPLQNVRLCWLLLVAPHTRG